MRTSSGRAATAPTVASVTCSKEPCQILQNRAKMKEKFEMHRTLADQIAATRFTNLSSAHVRETAVLYQPGAVIQTPSPGVAHAECLKQFVCADPSHSEEPESDQWLEATTCCVRVHESSRNCLFTPPRVAGIQPRQALAAVRITEGRYIDDGEEFRIVDNWTGRSAHRVLQRRWTGSTTFLRAIGPDASGR